MKKILFLLSALLLTTTMMTSCFKEKPDTSKEGLYVGIIGFNHNLTTQKLTLLNSGSKDDMKNFIDNLEIGNGTILYHAVNTALDKIESVTPPDDLINVSIVTFTDGQDQGSYEWNNNYNSGPEYLTAINNRIKTLAVGQNKVPVSAFAIGAQGDDVVDEASFRQNLAKLSSSPNNVFLVDNMSEVGDIFDSIAQDLYHQSSSWDVTLKISAPEPGTRLRFTFDKISNAEESELYIDGIFTNDNNISAFNITDYRGLQECESVIYPTTDSDKLKIFTFNNLLTANGEQVKTDNAKLWNWVNQEWHPNSEFTPSGNTVINEEFRSAMIMIVLDCSSSLGTDFQTVKNAARQFIEALSGNTHQ
jgi:hypothetical protein